MHIVVDRVPVSSPNRPGDPILVAGLIQSIFEETDPPTVGPGSSVFTAGFGLSMEPVCLDLRM